VIGAARRAERFCPGLAAALLITYTLVTVTASAQTYPDRPVIMIVAFPPGGAADATARILQDPMQKAPDCIRISR